MAHFEKAVNSLAAGGSVRRSQWDKITRIFLQHDDLMYQRGGLHPRPYQLSKEDIGANDWQVLDFASAV
jgi:hypothetical protein